MMPCEEVRCRLCPDLRRGGARVAVCCLEWDVRDMVVVVEEKGRQKIEGGKGREGNGDIILARGPCETR